MLALCFGFLLSMLFLDQTQPLLPQSTVFNDAFADIFHSCSQATRTLQCLLQQNQQAQQESQKARAWALVSTRSCWWEVSLRLEHTSIFR